MENETYFEITRHKNMDSVNEYLYSERLFVVEIVDLQMKDEFLKPLLLIVKKKN